MRYLLSILIAVFIPLSLFGADECFDCHDKYKKANHAKVDCTACHSDAKELPHPGKLKKPDCTACHSDAVRKFTASVHAEKQLSCKQCHSVHNLAQGTPKCVSCHPSVAHKSLPSARKHLAAAECTGCHSRKAHGEINAQVTARQPVLREVIDKNGDGRVDEKEWRDFLVHTQSLVGDTLKITRRYAARGSAHDIGKRAVSCSACHVENNVFRKALVEIRAPGQRLTLALDPHGVVPRLPVTELYALTSHGKNGVTCRDCHTSQGRIGDSVCIKCHEKVYNVYKGTAHAKGSAANCTDCHDPHKVKTYKELGPTERVAVCVRCHSDYKGKHRWLPHADLHFMYLECSTCHSPLSEKGMVFKINVRNGTGQRDLNYDDIARVFGTKKPARDLIDVNTDRRIASSEIVPFFDSLKKGTPGAIAINGSIVVTRIHHDYSQVQKRDKVCTTCHSDDAPFYQSMYLVLPEKEGFSYMPVKGTVLASMPASLAVNFVLLGETKLRLSDIRTLFRARGEARHEVAMDLGMRLIDIIGIFILVVVFILIAVHIILRVVFRR